MDRYIPSTLSSTIASMLCKKWWQKCRYFRASLILFKVLLPPTIITTNQRCFWINVAPVCAIGWEDFIPPQFWLNAVGISKHTHTLPRIINTIANHYCLNCENANDDKSQEKTKDDDDKRLCVCCVNVDPLKRTLIVCCPFSHDCFKMWQPNLIWWCV